MTLLQSLASELAITVADGAVWLAIAQGLLLGALCLVFGIWVARIVGLLEADAPAGETLAVGLASGLMVFGAWWAAIWSGGRSSFTPVAIGFAIAIVLALIRRFRARGEVDTGAEPASTTAADTTRWARNRPIALAALGGAVFIVAIALLYGSTMAPSPRNGVQPVEFMDEAFYAVLGRDLATTGTENNTLPSGFTSIDGIPAQTWYHWGELWLASAAITIFGSAPLLARHLVVLPLVLLAAASLTGTVVRRMARTRSLRAYAFGFIACLFLAPVPYVGGPLFGWWAVGLIFGVSLYGMAAVAVLLALYSLADLGTRAPSWELAAFVGSALAFILPAHIVIAFLVVGGVATVWAIRIARSLRVTRHLPIVAPIWQRTVAIAGATMVATVVWAVVTDHGLGGSAGVPATVSAFNETWFVSIAAVCLGAGLFLAIPLAWLSIREESPAKADIYLGTLALVATGAIVWGARLGDFNMFHFFFGGIAVVATPVAAVAAWTLWENIRDEPHRRLVPVALGALVVIQVEFGVVQAITRLQMFGPGDYAPIPVAVLAAIQELPRDAKIAYACEPFDEVAFTDPRLESIDAHTGRRIIPMCFEADYFSTLIGAELADSQRLPNGAFAWAPQRVIYPDVAADPTPAAVAAFMKDHGIGYIFVDSDHPNSLVSDAILVATSGDAALLKVP